MDSQNLRETICALIFDDEGHILVGKRTARKIQDVGRWQIPQGGVESSDSSFEVAAWREVQEEVNLTPDDLDLVGRLEETPVKYGKNKGPYAGSRYHWYLFHLVSRERLANVRVDNEAVPEFSAVQMMTWESLMKDDVVADCKRSMYMDLQDKILAGIALYRRHLNERTAPTKEE